MNRRYVAALALALSFGAVSAASAQRPEGPRAEQGMRGQRPGMGVRGLFRDITLTDSQKEQLKAIGARYQEQNKAIREQMKPLREEFAAARKAKDTARLEQLRERTKAPMQQMQQLHEKQIAEVRALLNADQQKQFDANVAKMKERGEKMRERGARGERGERGQRGARGAVRS